MKITLRPTAKQHQAYQALNDPLVNLVFMGGGAGGGKSWLICESRLINAYRFPGYKSFIGREELKRLMQSTYQTWIKVCKFHEIPAEDWHLNGQYNYIQFANGSRIDLLDLKFAPGDPLYERFGSTEYSDGAIEEAGEVHFLAYDVLKSRIGRHLNKELGIIPNTLATGNPKKNWTYDIYKQDKEGKLPRSTVFIQSLYRDNPHTAETYGQQLDQIKDPITRARLRDGEWEYDDSPNTMIAYNQITDMFTMTAAISQEKFLVVDAARFGGDKIVFSLWRGLDCYRIFYKVKQGIDQTILDIKELARDEQIPYSQILVDEDGVGGGIIDGLQGIKGFVANRTPFPIKDTVTGADKPANFSGLKAQCAYRFAELANAHQIAIKCEDVQIKKEIIEEIEQLKTKDADSDGKLKIIPKDEIKAAIGRSPDFLDTFIMRMYFEFDKRRGTVALEVEYIEPKIEEPTYSDIGI